MKHALFATVDAMLAPAALSRQASVPIHTVRCIPFRTVEAYSGSTFHRVETNDAQGPSYVLKRIPAPINRAQDQPCPAVALWQHGFLHRLPAGIVQVTAACAHDGAGYAVLMEDMRSTLLPALRPFTPHDNACFLDAMAAMHAAFWDDPHLQDARLGVYRPDHFYGQTMQDAVVWAHLEHCVDPDVARLVRTLLDDPTLLGAALRRYPATLVHNDLWWANLGIRREPRSQVVVLDWDFATVAPPAVDLAFYIGENAALLPIAKDDVIAYYQACLAERLGARFDASWWRPQVELGLLGCFLRRGKWLVQEAFHAPDAPTRTWLADEFAWWSQHIRRGVQHL